MRVIFPKEFIEIDKKIKPWRVEGTTRFKENTPQDILDLVPKAEKILKDYRKRIFEEFS